MTIYLIRHAQSAFNAVHDPKKPDPMIFDAPITALGETQARNARSEVKELDIKNVIVSPFTRTLQTAKLIFGNRLPFQIDSEVREQLCNSCDVGSGKSVNVLNHAVMVELESILDRLESKEDLNGVAMLSGKQGGFVYGADIHEFETLKTAGDVANHMLYVHGLFNRIEALPVPSCVGVDGIAVGGWTGNCFNI